MLRLPPNTQEQFCVAPPSFSETWRNSKQETGGLVIVRAWGAANCALMIVLVSMLNGQTWGWACSLLRFTAGPCVHPRGNKTNVPDQQQSLINSLFMMR